MSVQGLYKNPLFWVTITLPFVLSANIPLLPTYDDWSSTPGPNPNPFTWELLLPMNSYWRPLENLYGYLIAHYRWLMPWLPHVLVVCGHYIGCCYVYRICRRLYCSAFAQFVATIFFWFSVGAIPTVTACDGMSQTWTHTLGLIALYKYLKSSSSSTNSYSWLLIVALATLVKENGLSWGLAIPVVAYSFNLTDRQTFRRHLIYGFLFALSYTIFHFSLPVAEDYHLSEEYFHPSFLRTLRGVALLLSFTWLPIDYIHLLHQPHRNFIAVCVSLLMLAPFIFLTFCRQFALYRSRIFIGLLIAFFLLVGPHLITIFSLMHTYASLGVAALITGYFANQADHTRAYRLAFVSYVLVSVAVDMTHCRAAYQSGLLGKRLSTDAIQGAGHPVEKAMLIIVNQGDTRYSNFFVIPFETFDKGRGILWETNYAWPKELESIEVPDESQIISHTTDSIIESDRFDCIWVLKDTVITTILPRQN